MSGSKVVPQSKEQELETCAWERKTPIISSLMRNGYKDVFAIRQRKET